MFQLSLTKSIARLHATVKPRLFVFAGQGIQQKGMLDHIPSSLRNEAVQVGKEVLGIDLYEVATTDSKNLINETEITQPLLLLSHYLEFHNHQYNHKLSSHDYMIGHSLGEYSALVNSRSISLAQGLKLVYHRGKLMKAATKEPHGMLYVRVSEAKMPMVRDMVHQAGLEIACYNSPTNIIIAGLKDKIHDFSVALKTQKIISKSLAVSTAFHCKNLEGMVEDYKQILDKINFWVPKCHVLRNYDCKSYKSPSSVRDGLLKQLTHPVLFEQSVKKVPQGIKLIEVGHKEMLKPQIEEIWGHHHENKTEKLAHATTH